MLVVRFDSESVWKDCCNAAHMRRTWGARRALLISMRIQQIEAMNSIEDLAFMPFDHDGPGGGHIEVALDDEMSLFMVVDRGHHSEDGAMHTAITIRRIGRRTVAVAR